MNKSPITTHILDLEHGRPATGVHATLIGPESTALRVKGVTDSDGRIIQWDTAFQLTQGLWQIVFDTGAWFESQNRQVFFPTVNLSFVVEGLEQHYHVPLLLNGHGYSTYRGS